MASKIMENKTLADFGALTKEELESLTPEELEEFKSSIIETEQKAREELNAKLTKLEELARNYKIRSEKAEAEVKKLAQFAPKTSKTSETEASNKTNTASGELSQSDLIALIKADVAEEDFDNIIEYARLKGISVSEALKTNVVKAFLAEKAEERKTANATNTKSSSQSSEVKTGEELLEAARKTGEIPDNEEDVKKMIAARFGRK